METFTFRKFAMHALKAMDPDVLNTEFLDKWNNKKCISLDEPFLITPFEWAAQWGSLPMVKYLLENGANNITANSNYPIRWAMINCHKNIIKYLLSTNIYPEEVIHEYAEYLPHLKELVIDYIQFPRTKACR